MIIIWNNYKNLPSASTGRGFIQNALKARIETFMIHSCVSVTGKTLNKHNRHTGHCRDIDVRGSDGVIKRIMCAFDYVSHFTNSAFVVFLSVIAFILKVPPWRKVKHGCVEYSGASISASFPTKTRYQNLVSLCFCSYSSMWMTTNSRLCERSIGLLHTNP